VSAAGECRHRYDWHDIAFVKIDAEGEESRILQGGAPLVFQLVLDDAGPYAALALSSTLIGLSFVLLLFLRPPRR